jgi:adenine phosphoribosyltransferase|tara:strand:+ start:142 stop:657 length:516 start_codon:yes stop_codon:yes gene_type:complete
MKTAKDLILAVPDFPKPGILFRDITPVLESPEGFREVIDAFRERYAEQNVSYFAGIESRGFIFAAALAHAMGKGFVVIRKPGKLPRETFSESYALEYGEDQLEIHQDAVGKNDRVVIIDDLIATGGTAAAAAKLVGQCGAEVVEVAVVIELKALEGRAKLEAVPVHALIDY